VSQLQPGDIDWDALFGGEGARWFHTGGIFCGLSATTPQVAREAIQAARRHGTIVSYDLNFRESLWQAAGGMARAQAVNRELAPRVDVLLGGTAALGIEADGDRSDVRRALGRTAKEFPNLKVVATPLRTASTATVTGWGALCYAGGAFLEARTRQQLEVLDRVGSGDAFAAGLIYGLLADRGAQYGVDCGAALGALTMTTPGDSAMATLAEVEALMQGGSAGRVRR
jgi:2-dehydro-3-deoxygluconokinase